MRQTAQNYSVMPNLEGDFDKEPLPIKQKKSQLIKRFCFGFP